MRLHRTPFSDHTGNAGNDTFVFHAGFGLFSNDFSSGKILYWTFFALVATGVVWRLVYWVVPGIAAPKVGNYSVAGSRKRAEDLLTEIEKLESRDEAETAATT